jgi:O-antigen/teichoic acid export membrane protein
MTISRSLLFKGAAWTVAAFGAGQVVRLITNILLARLLAPQLFGIMQIVYSFRTGFELISDVGIGPNIIYNKDADQPEFYNTAWTVQWIRGIVLWFVFSAAAAPLASFYHSPVLASIIPVAALAIVMGSFASTSRYLLQKRMSLGRLTIFDTLVAVIASAGQVIWAYIDPTLWALVIGPLFGTAFLMIGSHFLLPGMRQRPYISRHYAIQILSFGKWIFVSSIVYFLSTNFDRLYFAKTIPLALLGVYGIARSFSELVGGVVLNLGNSVIFPFVASHAHSPRPEFHKQLAPLRLKFLLLTGLGLALLAATADLVIQFLYDQRYQAAAWMLPILIAGTWFAVLSNLNESCLLGLGRPNYSVLGNSGKFAFLILGLVIGVGHYGVLGGVVAVAVSDIGRYFALLIGQVRERFSFFGQDVVTTIAIIALIALAQWVRHALGFGTSFDAIAADIL